MINYEVMFVIDPAIEDDKKEATIEAVKGIIAAEGEVGNADVWGMKKLAYRIQGTADSAGRARQKTQDLRQRNQTHHNKQR